MSYFNKASIVNYLLAQEKDLVAICDTSGNILEANATLAHIAEKSIEELKSQSVETLFSDENRKLNQLIYSKVKDVQQEETFVSNIQSVRQGIRSVSFKVTKLQNFKIIKGTVTKANADNLILNSDERFETIINHASDCFFILDDELGIIFQNKAASKIFTHPHFHSDTNKFFASFPEETNLKFYDHFAKSLQSKIHLKFVEYSTILNSWFSIDVVPTGDELNILVCDMSSRIFDHKINELELKTFEMNISKEKPVDEILRFLLNGFEGLYPQMNTSILRIEDQKVWHVASPSLPDTYCQQMNGHSIGPQCGSCGTAAYLKKTVITFDIETDPNWVNYKSLIAPYGYQSCWSFPILSNKSLEVMATLAIYTKENRTPTENELKSIARLCNIVKIIFEDLKHDDFALLMNNRYKMVTKATNDAIYDWDLRTGNVYWSDNLYNIFGFTPQEAHQSKNWWINHVHRGDRAETIRLLKNCLRKKESGWTAEYRLKCKESGFKYVYNRGYIIYDSQNLPVSIIGALQDVSALKEREIEIINQNNKLKEIAQISSHDLRRPVTSILGLISLFNKENLAEENNIVIIDYLRQATQELDNVIHAIVAKTLEADETIYDKHIKLK